MAGKDIITMKHEELRRLHIIRQVLDKRIRQVEAVEKLELSDRQVRRIIKRVKSEGDKGIIHRLRGKPSSRKIDDKIKELVIKLYRGKYKGFGPTLASEKLFEIEKVKVSDETLRNWLLQKGLWQRTRKHKKYRRWRERKHYFGEMIQWDGSHHDWFEGRGFKCVLIGQIDDATSMKNGQFYKYEGTIPSFASLKMYIKKHGIPYSIYLDKHTTYKSPKKLTIEDELNDRKHLSQLERAAKEMGIKIIHANSAPAKGRIERSFKTDQDRLVKEMRLEGISTIKEANKFIKSYWLKHNKRFSVNPLKNINMHRAVPKGTDLDAILCIKKEHSVRNDFTIVHNKKLYQIQDRKVGKKVRVEEKINGAMHIIYNGRRCKYKQIQMRPTLEKKSEFKPRKIFRPCLKHPWKKASYDKRLAACSKKKKTVEELILINN